MALFSRVFLIGISICSIASLACRHSNISTDGSTLKVVFGHTIDQNTPPEYIGPAKATLAIVGKDPQSTRFRFVCTGALVAPDLVITAAHCKTEQQIDNLEIYVTAVNDLPTLDFSGNRGSIFAVKQWFLAPPPAPGFPPGFTAASDYACLV